MNLRPPKKPKLFAIKITSWNPMPDDGLFIGVSGTDGLGGVGKAGVLDRC